MVVLLALMATEIEKKSSFPGAIDTDELVAATEVAVAEGETAAIRARGYWESVWLRLRKDKLALAGAGFVVFLVFVAFAGAPTRASIRPGQSGRRRNQRLRRPEAPRILRFAHRADRRRPSTVAPERKVAGSSLAGGITAMLQWGVERPLALTKIEGIQSLHGSCTARSPRRRLERGAISCPT
jgi:hypothetical protein